MNIYKYKNIYTYTGNADISHGPGGHVRCLHFLYMCVDVCIFSHTYTHTCMSRCLYVFTRIYTEVARTMLSRSRYVYNTKHMFQTIEIFKCAYLHIPCAIFFWRVWICSFIHTCVGLCMRIVTCVYSCGLRADSSRDPWVRIPLKMSHTF